MAVPGPTMAPENTGSGTAASPMARPARGDVTVVMGSLPGVEIQKEPSLPVPDGDWSAGYGMGDPAYVRELPVGGPGVPPKRFAPAPTSRVQLYSCRG
ncbi:hypothetical protein GCM10010389_63330 [Streptomyces echinoruber]|uniref:Uncharacterized protein n=1 Tax=Streptomyces echinoruber TaxID=68898 RepID=A0A918RYZ0_9ACTN|nr:hypothetical protein GCM10010389_63330 [Streptomyces echinoruber]